MTPLIVTTNLGKTKVKYPTTREELTVDQFQKIITDWDGNDRVKLFSILSGINYKSLYDSNDKGLVEQLLIASQFVYDPGIDFKNEPLPHWLDIDGKQIRIPIKIGSLSIGQNIHVKEALERNTVYESLISFTTAIYLQPLYDETRDFDFHSAMELEQKILAMPVYKIFPIGFFLLKPQMKSGRNIFDRLDLLNIHLQRIFIKGEEP